MLRPHPVALAAHRRLENEYRALVAGFLDPVGCGGLVVCGGLRRCQDCRAGKRREAFASFGLFMLIAPLCLRV
jgi:hypothetical protein